MKKNIIPGFVFLLNTLLITTGYGQTASISAGCAPLEVKFEAPEGYTSFFWDFKDGVTSVKQEPVNIFNKAGTYDVSFHETPDGPVVGTVKITVFPDPELSFDVVSLGCAPYNAQFQNTSKIDPAINVNNYVWVFGDGQKLEGEENPSHNYPDLGFYDVSLEIQTDHVSCNRTQPVEGAIEVISKPNPNFVTSPNSTISCTAPFEVSFTNHSTGTKNLEYTWDLGNGNVSTDKTPANQIYEEGQYTIRMEITYPNTLNCTRTQTKSVSVGSPQPEIILSDDSLCRSEAALISTNTPGRATWDYGTEYLLTPAPDNKKYLSYSKGGNYTVTLTVTSLDGVCSGTTTKDIYVDGIKAEIESTPDFSCESPMTINYKAIVNQDDVDYHWTFPRQNDSLSEDSVDNPVRTYIVENDKLVYSVNKKELFPAILNVTSNKTGCFATATAVDTLWRPNSLFMPDNTRGCAPLTVSFSDSSESRDPIIEYRWVFGDGEEKLTYTPKMTFEKEYTQPGEYEAYLIVTTERGCVDTSYSVLFEVGDRLSSEVDFVANKTEVCPGEHVEFSVSKTVPEVDAYRFSTEDNRSFHCQDQQSLSWSYNNESGPQDVSLIVDYNGCLSTISKSNLVMVKGSLPKMDYYASCDAPYTYTFFNNGKNATSLTWDLGGELVSNQDTITHTFSQNKNYLISLTAENGDGCPSLQEILTVKVRDPKARVSHDTSYCINGPAGFNAAESEDVYEHCYKGYTWQFPTMKNQRPYTTSSPGANFKFTEKGEHTVRLIVTDENGCKDTTETEIKVYDMQVAANADDLSICNPALVKFTDATVSDTALASWEWELEENFFSDEQNPELNFTDPPANNTNYPVTLKVTDSLGCSEEYDFTIDHYKPTTRITTSDNTICIGDTVEFSAADYTDGGSGLKFFWDFGNGETSTDQTNKILYKSLRDYDIKLNYEEILTGCKDSATETIQIQGYPTAGYTAAIDTELINSSSTICAPTSITFEDTSKSNYNLTYRWDYGNGRTLSGKGPRFFTYDKGKFETSLIVSTSFNCRDTASLSFQLFKPEGSMEVSTNKICKGDEVLFSIKDTTDVASFTWIFGTGDSLSNVGNTSHKYAFHPPSGSTKASLYLYSKEGCWASESKTITIHQVIADFARVTDVAGMDSTICFNDGPYPFTNLSSNANTYKWDLGDGEISNETNPVHQYAASGEYDVTLMVENTQLNCKDTITKTAFIYDNPVVKAVGDTVCLGTEVKLEVLEPEETSNYTWFPSTGLSNPGAPGTVANIDTTIFYQVVETDTNTCTGFAEAPAVIVRPIGLNNWDTTIVVGDTAVIPAKRPDLYIFNWNPEEGLSCTDCNYPVIQPLEDITYQLTVTDSLGCFTTPIDYKVFVKPETFVKLPTTFSPNGDGLNDIIYVKGWGIKELVEFKVFNRWGQEIYSSGNIDEGWNGKYNGVVQNSDMYVYKVKVRTWRGEELYKEGYINLIH